MRDQHVKSVFIRSAALLCAALSVSACAGAGGSCVLDATAASGYVICEDYQGTEFNESVGENSCNTAGGVYSPETCDTTGAIGFCEIAINAAQQYSYTYLPSSSSTASQTTLASACGVAGGVYSATVPK